MDSSCVCARPRRTRRVAIADAVLVVAVLGALFCWPQRLWGQTCPSAGSVPSPDQGAAFLATTSGDCAIDGSGYVKKQDTGLDPAAYRVHFWATVTGGCQTQKLQCSGLPPSCQCVNDRVYVRNLGTSSVYRNGTLILWIAASGTVQHYNTSGPIGTTSPGWSWKPTSSGTSTFTSIIKTNATPCNLQPTESLGAPLIINVLTCRPEWFSHLGVFFRAPSGPIRIVLPIGFEILYDAALLAAASWEAALGRTITIEHQIDPHAPPCPPDDGLCLTFADDYGSRPGETDCAALDTNTYAPNGEWLGPLVIRLKPSWAMYPVDSQTWLIAHELGHYFGLDNRIHQSCSSGDTVMNYCELPLTDPRPVGTSLGPTQSDAEALLNSTYGPQSKQVCGW